MARLLELDPENEKVGLGGALPLGSADGAGAGHEAGTQKARGGVQGEGGAGGIKDDRTVAELPRHKGSPEPDLRLEKAELLDGAVSVIEGGGTASEDTASAVHVNLLYRQIGLRDNSRAVDVEA